MTKKKLASKTRLMAQIKFLVVFSLSTMPFVEMFASEKIKSTWEQNAESRSKQGSDRYVLKENENSAELKEPSGKEIGKTAETPLDDDQELEFRRVNYSGSAVYQKRFDSLAYPSLGMGSQMILNLKPWLYTVSLGGLKRFIIASQDEELELTAVNLATVLQLEAIPLGMSQTMRANIAFPVTYAARLNQSWGRLDLSYSISRSEWNIEGIVLNSTSMLSLYLSRYKTRHPDFGASALPKLFLNTQLSLSYTVNSRLALAAVGSYGRLYSHKVAVPSHHDSYLSHPYSLSLSGSFKVSDQVGVGVRYQQGDTIEDYGKTNFYVFDRLKSSLSLSMNYGSTF